MRTWSGEYRREIDQEETWTISDLKKQLEAFSVQKRHTPVLIGAPIFPGEIARAYCCLAGGLEFGRIRCSGPDKVFSQYVTSNAR